MKRLIIPALLFAVTGISTSALAQGYYNAQNPYTQSPGYQSQSYSYGGQQQQQAPAAQYPQQNYYGQQAYPQYPQQQANPYGQQPAQAPAQTVSAGTLGAMNRQINFPRDAGDDVDVLKLQIFLDYHGYSPGEIDGKWGYNTERALFAYQKHNGMSQTGQMDDRIMQRLNSFQDGYLLEYSLTSGDVNGGYGKIPRTYQEQSVLKRLPYESLKEAMAEKFHMSQTLLQKLNPNVNLEGAQVGSKILVINVKNGIDEKRGKVTTVKVSKSGKWVEAYDASGNFMFYFPCTIGNDQYDPLPIGSYKITTAVKNPTFEYKPELMWDDNVGKRLTIPPGPNSPVGDVWIATTRKSVGLHGTPNPENISKNNSHGCIRLANWDARQLADRVMGGANLEFIP